MYPLGASFRSSTVVTVSGFRAFPKLVLTCLFLLAACAVSEAASQVTLRLPSGQITPAVVGRPQITVSGALSNATVGAAYETLITATGGQAPYHIRLAGALPAGPGLNPTNGKISGTPTVAGVIRFTIGADRPRFDFGAHRFALAVVAPLATPSGITVEISPSGISLAAGATQQFTALVRETPNVAVVWAASQGTISASGLFTAPRPSAAVNVVVTATSMADPTKKAAATITVEAASPLPSSPVINTRSLPAATTGTSYTAALAASGGTAPYHWTLAAGVLPPGLTLSAAGIISGTPTQSGTFSLTARVTDSGFRSGTQVLALLVSTQASTTSRTPSVYDGPAELPRSYVQSALTDTPAPGQLISVNAGGNLQSALNSAICGDTLSLQAGATFSGTFTFPAKNCDDGHWIIVRTSAPDSSLPPEGTRLTPCYAGMASYPSRPAYPCPDPQNVLAKISNPTMATSGPIVFNGDHYRLVGLEITRANRQGLVYDLISASTPAANHIVLDRIWAHGIEQSGHFPQTSGNSTETKRGLNLGQSNTVAVVDSYFSDFYCDGTLSGCDAQSIAGGWGSTANSGWGQWKVVNSHLEGAAEGLLLGGANGPTNAARDVPCDVEIRSNLFFKPLTWASGNTTTAGWPVEKNGLELKTGCRILIEGNLIQNVWYNAQVGQAIVVAPKNQSSHGQGTCPTCIVTDLVVRDNKSYNTASGVGIFNSEDMGCTSNCASLGMYRVYFHDNLHDDIHLPQGSGADGYEVSTNPGSPMDQVWIVHNTVTSAHRSAFELGGPAVPNQTNMVIRDNIVAGGTYGSVSVGSGGCQGTAVTALAIMTACWNPFTFTHNVIFGAKASTFPDSASNFFPATGTAVGFVSYNAGNGGDYHLSASSPYKNAASDGKDPGADIDSVTTDTIGLY